MKNEKNKESIDLLDILRGYSVVIHLDQPYYFKHFLLIDLLEFDNLHHIDIEKSVKAGIKTEKDLIDLNIERGIWSISKEEKIKSLEWMIKKSTTTLGKIQDPVQRKVFHEQLESQEGALRKIKVERAQICSYSAESLAEVKRVKRMTEKSIFSDKDFTKPTTSEERNDLMPVMFSRHYELNRRDTIIRASYFGGFFELFAAQGGNSAQLIDKTFCDMTSLQKGLIVLSNALLNKLKNTKIPDEIAGDPVKIMDYEEKEEGTEKTSHGIEDLKQKMRARGGELKAEDFLS